MKPWLNWMLGIATLALIVVPPTLYYRSLYSRDKRLREVTPGKFYRSGQLTAEGFRDAIERLGIRTVINVQEEFPDPALAKTFWDRSRESEKGLCGELGVRYVHLTIDPATSEADIAKYLAILDDPDCYPVLLHCLAGLHRTGVLTALYRMEYEGWSHAAAAAELKGSGFNVHLWYDDCTRANTYVQKFVLDYRPRRPSDRAAVGGR